MFVCHTPPFRGRGRRGHNRGWRTCLGPHGTGLGNRPRGLPAQIYTFERPFFPVEAVETELEDVGSEYCFRRAVPGIAPEALHVDVEGPVLTVRSLTEVPGQRFEWRVVIPDDVSSECITAEVENGFLSIRMPKVLPRTIPVTSNGTMTENGLWKFENWGSEYRLTHPAHGVEADEVVVRVEEGFMFVHVHSPNARFSREVSLPPAVDVDAIMVDIEDDMLVVTLPKLERNEIRIHASGASSSRQTPREGEEEDEALYNEARHQA